jgi:hypothetical protein
MLHWPENSLIPVAQPWDLGPRGALCSLNPRRPSLSSLVFSFIITDKSETKKAMLKVMIIKRVNFQEQRISFAQNTISRCNDHTVKMFTSLA